MTAPKMEKVYSMPQAAKAAGIHRVTLFRMEERGLVPQPGWIMKGRLRVRAYTEAEVNHIKNVVAQTIRRTDGAQLVPASQIIRE